MRIWGLMLAACIALPAAAQVEQTKGNFVDKFRQLEEQLPTPNVYRTGSGAPGHEYWQQQVDYKIKVSLDEKKRTITGSENIKYINNSPDTLTYLWLQMDQNKFSKHSDAFETMTQSDRAKKRLSYYAMDYIARTKGTDWGFHLTKVESKGKKLDYVVNDTMMRIDLPKPLAPGASIEFDIDWWYHIPEAKKMGARGGFEPYERHGNDVYFIAQWFPRLAAYTDLAGWEHKQFLGTGEFTLEFGDYDVEITVPADHIVGSTGELQNAKQVLTKEQRERFEAAKTAERPVFIVNREEALENEKEGTDNTKTWRFKAENVRDFAFASSRKFVWDAWGVKMPESDRTVLAMSLYPEEAMPLWDKYSTQSIAHTLETYSRYSIEYPYPVAWSVNGPIGGGMEYPMITSNGPRPTITKDKDGEEERTYSRRAKYGLISVIIHEIGHVYFPMVINSDERNWAWMDEGLNSFLQSRAEREWQEYYPSRYSHPRAAIPYMQSENQTPIMTQSDSILGYFPNAYIKPAVALNVLRETVMGRELFDFAFKEYSKRWAFKRPYPADFFRTMEDASAQDLDWFWRGWFYSTDHVDIAINGLTHARLAQDPETEAQIKREKELSDRDYIAELRNQAEGINTRVNKFPELLDFYNEYDQFTVTESQKKGYERKLKGLKDWERELLQHGHEIYFIDFENIGGLVMPLVLAIEYTDGTTEELRIPAEIWRKNAKKATKMLVRDKEIKNIILDPHHELADVEMANNYWPERAMESRVEMFKGSARKNLMQRVLADKKRAEKAAKAKANKN
ncbi:M1 family metallopeptidase [Kordiimonas laminariae]|uniref:M1 family metallopeptidase n=1 Tax=Kordiimonas laminariae TaxID=2917717 RepID=UPI001FF1F662|nr:M1 family metallopeptidase [Kordiimonas laminariae]MCK0069590.1 M1 family metallopeptidase [Kordiimonas laminariae]